ncbi:MAG: monovalent cation/H+ antiporter complex subunit F [Planctomycetota bacterium]
MNPCDPGSWLTVMPLLAAAESASQQAHDGPGVGELFAPLLYAVVMGMVVTGAGMLLCLYRLMAGPSLPDRVIAADLFALHVVAAVVLLTIYLGDDTYFGSVLGIAIIGFASTVGFAQLIGATGDNADLPPAGSTSVQNLGPLDRGDKQDPHVVNVCPETGRVPETPTPQDADR